MPNPSNSRRRQLKHWANPVSVRDLDAEQLSLVAVVNTAAVDRYNTIILPRGARLTAYRKNPVVLWAHSYREPPIARAEWIRVEADNGGGDVLKAKVVFAKGNLFAEEIFRLYQQGVMRAFSIGWMDLPKGYHKPTDKDLEKHPEWEGVDLVYTKWELLEFSAVPVPGNPDALIDEAYLGQMEDRLQECGQAVLVRDLEPLLRQETGDETDQSEEPPPEEPAEEESISEAQLVAAAGRPYENEHACRLKDPKLFDPDSIKSRKQTHDGKEYRVIYGKLKADGKSADQSNRYPTAGWSAEQARAHCDSKDGTFEAAKKTVDQLAEEVAELRTRVLVLETPAKRDAEAEVVRQTVANFLSGVDLRKLLSSSIIDSQMRDALTQAVSVHRGRMGG